MAVRTVFRRFEVRVGEERMDAKRFVVSLLVSLVALGSARSQAPLLAPPVAPVAPASEPVQAGPLVEPPPGGYDVPGISNWIRRDSSTCASCTGPIGKNAGIGEELYFRSGPSLPLGDGKLLSRNLAVGFEVQAGARTLFFNHQYDRAWTVDFSVSNTYNSGVTRGDTFILPSGTAAPGLPVTIRSVNRTFVNLGAGREWFLYPALNSPSHLRYGVDGGGRYGSGKFSLNETGYRGDVIGGAYLGAHMLYEFGFRESIVNIGLRTEYSYTWSDVFYRASDLSELNILINVGVRY